MWTQFPYCCTTSFFSIHWSNSCLWNLICLIFSHFPIYNHHQWICCPMLFSQFHNCFQYNVQQPTRVFNCLLGVRLALYSETTHIVRACERCTYKFIKSEGLGLPFTVSLWARSSEQRSLVLLHLVPNPWAIRRNPLGMKPCPHIVFHPEITQLTETKDALSATSPAFKVCRKTRILRSRWFINEPYLSI